MGMFDSTELNEHTAIAARELFNRIVEAENASLTEEQRGDMRAYLLDAWHKSAEAVMRPIRTRAALEEELSRLRPNRGPFDTDLDD